MIERGLYVLHGSTRKGCYLLFQRLNSPKSAVQKMEKCVELHVKYLGNHRDTAITHKKLGSLYNRLEEFDKAQKQFEAALEINTCSLYGPTKR
ncbi:predicted protein [Chaetoceros tenuissimus]|uniref:Uncharacterized protein n=1 Tax=Chaetoceros tenuissimus TaxID=426638 RepID=A0AAD3CZV7_9STRA|nr:predicted protein [Chaetoceros tenuissimus]